MQNLRSFIIWLSVFTASYHCTAQNDFRHQFAVGLGFPYTAPKSHIRDCPLLRVQYERSISRFSVGIVGAVGVFTAYKLERYLGINIFTDETLELAIVGLRINYYILSRDRFDVYAGALASLSSAGAVNDYYLEKQPASQGLHQLSKPVSESTGFRMGLHTGGHFWFRERLGAWAELSYGLGLINAGIVIRR